MVAAGLATAVRFTADAQTSAPTSSDVRAAASVTAAAADEIDALTAQVADLQAQLDAANATIADLEAQLAALSPQPTTDFGVNVLNFGAFQTALGEPLTVIRIYGGAGVNWPQPPAGTVPILDTKALPTAANIAAVKSYIATLGVRPVISYAAEPEDNFGGTKNSTTDRPNFAAFKANFQAWHDAVPEADWAFCLMGQTFRNPSIWGSADDWWPGDADIVAVDSYAKAFPYPDAEYLYGPARDYAASKGLPWAVYETGLKRNNSSTSADRAAWFQAFGTWLAQQPLPAQWLYFENTDNSNDYEIRTEPDTMAALAAVVRQFGNA